MIRREVWEAREEGGEGGGGAEEEGCLKTHMVVEPHACGRGGEGGRRGEAVWAYRGMCLKPKTRLDHI